MNHKKLVSDFGFRISSLSLTLVLALATSASASVTNDLPRFQEVYKLLRENVGGVSASELDQAAVKGLINQLKPQALLGEVGATGVAGTSGLAKTHIYDNAFLYFQISSVTDELADKIMAAYRDIAATNKTKIKGVVLDLRFATGSDFAAAAKAADDFLNNEQLLLQWGTNSVNATKKRNAITVPVAILVNHETSGAAEAFAAVLRDTNVGLLIGSLTAGHASVYKTFPLSDGEKLRIATAQIKVAGKKVLDGPLKPDIKLDVAEEDERKWLADPYKVLHKPETAKDADADSIASEGTSNAPIRRRMNEAELVRAQREGVDPETDLATERPKSKTDDVPVLSDPALLRGLDLLKGLAVVQPHRAS
ncbi:MAG: carboxyl-terminal protease [Verrucomicrobiales bacterium]|nr:carboxyl-terminal protease [Verrucomicrobiales bacterium]